MEESGLPELLTALCGTEGWLLLRKLVEIDCDVNLTPQWFPFAIPDLSRWTGIAEERVGSLLENLETGEWIERANREMEVQTCRIVTPMKVPLNEAVIRRRLSGETAQGGRFVLRYFQDHGSMNTVEKVIYLYQMLFGARFSPRIVEDLEEIANTFDMAIIYDTFKEAFSKKVKSLAWIKSHLKMSVTTGQP